MSSVTVRKPSRSRTVSVTASRSIATTSLRKSTCTRPLACAAAMRSSFLRFSRKNASLR
ncbi:MAG: hypothetical protein JNL90_00295 [Planctomycetes bacterium]|nr:hypothetical protein [Planctomycetota bacterium]